jgi:hypothetical protein
VCLFHSKNVGESEASRYMGSETNLPHLRWTSQKKNPCAVERLSGVCLDKRIRKGYSRFERKKKKIIIFFLRGPMPCCVRHAVESFPFFHSSTTTFSLLYYKYSSWFFLDCSASSSSLYGPFRLDGPIGRSCFYLSLLWWCEMDKWLLIMAMPYRLLNIFTPFFFKYIFRAFFFRLKPFCLVQTFFIFTRKDILIILYLSFVYYYLRVL